MHRLIMKMAPRIPELISRALAGDAGVIALLAAMGIMAIVEAVKEHKGK